MNAEQEERMRAIEHKLEALHLRKDIAVIELNKATVDFNEAHEALQKIGYDIETTEIELLSVIASIATGAQITSKISVLKPSE